MSFADEFDRIRKGLVLLVREALSSVDYFALYEATVVSQNANGTLELRTETSKLPGLQQVPIRHGIPGVEVDVVAGGRVLVGFRNGDPSRPFAALWDAATVSEIRLAGGSSAVVRSGDSIVVTGSAPGTLIITSVTGTGSGKVKA